jgi:hypothetical protein
MRQDHEAFNGSTALIVHTLGEIMADVRSIKHDTHETMIVTHVLTRRLDSLERPSLLDRLKDLSGFLTALAVVLLAIAGKYDLIGYLVGSSK